MADPAAPGPAVRTTGDGALPRCQAWWPGSRRRRTAGRLALAELDIRKLDERIDDLLEVLAQVCDYAGQLEAAEEFRALYGEPAPAAPVLRLVRGPG